MPKKLLQIKKFDLGIINAVDESDIPEGGLANATNVMCDIPGKIRPMAQDKIHDDLNNEISAVITPGYGLYAYRSDFRISDDSPIESKILAFQNNHSIGIYDVESVDGLLLLGDGTQTGSCKPSFFYSSIDGGLRVCDGNYDNISYQSLEDESLSDSLLDPSSHIFVKYLKYINKTWFPADVTYHDSTTGYDPDQGFSTHNFASANDNRGLDAFIYPPTVLAKDASGAIELLGSVDTNSHNLIHNHATDASTDFSATNIGHMNFDTYGGGNIALQVGKTTDNNGTWFADPGLQFGVSLVYEGYDGGQESAVTNFQTIYNSGTPITDDGYSLDVQMFVSTKGWDPRVVGINLYLTGNDSGEFADPKKLLEFYFGSSKFDPPYLKSSDGDLFDADNITIDQTNDVAYIDDAEKIVIKNEPSLTFELLNGYKHNTESLAANFQTAVMTNRRLYIGGVRRLKFDVNTIANQGWQNGQNATYKQPEITLAEVTPELDTIYISPVEKFDIFPAENGLSVGGNDGERIIALHEFADRLLQFKTNKLYIINLSQDMEYIEAVHDYMGILYPYQVIRTERGVVWVNKNGCYIYDGEQVKNLINGKLHKNSPKVSEDQVEGWADFTGNTGMVGYVPVADQLVVFENPEAASIGSAGNAFVYDFNTGSWTKAKDVLSALPKSNIVTNYDNTCIYASLAEATTEELSTSAQVETGGADAWWTIDDCNAPNITTDVDGSKLKIGSQDITNTFHYPDGISNNFISSLFREVNTKVGQDLGITLLENGAQIKITRASSDMDGTYTGALSWDTSGSLGPPTTSAINLVPLEFQVKLRNAVNSINDGSPFLYTNEVIWSNLGVVNVNGDDVVLTSNYFNSLSNLYILTGDINTHYTSDTIRDEPRVMITYTGGTFWDNDNDATINFDLYSARAVENGNIALITGSADDGWFARMQHFNQPKVDGTGDLGPTQVADGDLILSHTSLSAATIKIPTAVFGAGGSSIEDFGSHGYYIIFPGDWSDSFTNGQTVTIGGVEASANANKDNALNISLVLHSVAYYDLNQDLGDRSALGYTSLQFNYYEQPSATQVDNWPYLINWTTFNNITISQAGAATIGSTNEGIVSDPGFYYITPKRNNTYSGASSDDSVNNIASVYHLGIDGQNGEGYSVPIFAPIESSGWTISNDMKEELELIYANANSKPFSLPDFKNIDRAEILYNVDNATTATLDTSISANDTTSFVLSDTRNLVKGQYLQFLGSLTSTSGAEIVRVTDISSANTTTITVVRAQLGTSALSSISSGSGTGIFKVSPIYQANSVTIRIYGGDYRRFLTANTLFKVFTGNDTAGANAWAEQANWYTIAFSTYTTPAATGHYTTVVLNTAESNPQAYVGNSSYDGADSSYYTIQSDGRSLIETSVLKLPGRLSSSSGLPALSVSGLVTRSLEIREFLNTEKFANSSSNDVIIETGSYDFGDSGQDVKLYKVSMNAKLDFGMLRCSYSVDGDEYKPLYSEVGTHEYQFTKNFESKDLYFTSNTDMKIPITAKRLKLKIEGVVRGFHLNDISIVYRPKGGVK